jgi:hypothetical protein
LRLDLSSCFSPDTQPHLAIFGVCQGIFPALTNPKNREHTQGIGGKDSTAAKTCGPNSGQAEISEATRVAV